MAETEPQGTPNATRAEEFIEARDGTRLATISVTPVGAKAQLYFVHGYSDHTGRYDHLFDHLASHGYAVHAFDYRGHGRSGGRRGHVDRFTDYPSDLEDFIAHVAPTLPEGQKRFVVAHSNGGLITARWLLDHPSDVAGVVMTGPFMKLGFEPPAVKVFFSKLIGKVIPFLPVKNELSPEMLTHDSDFQKKTIRDPLYNQVTTPRWFTETMAAQEEIRRRASEITVPILVMQGTDDPVVSPEASRTFFDAVTSRDKTWESYEGFRHELYMEVERDRPMQRLVSWLDERL